MTRPLRVYVAGASAEPARVAWAMAAVREAGAEVALDWRIGHRPTAELTTAERYAAAVEDLRAIRGSDIVWVLAPRGRSDAAVEMGLALGARLALSGAPGVIVSGRVEWRGIFAALAGEEHDRDEDALASIAALVEGGA